jgi:hypothetical protein
VSLSLRWAQDVRIARVCGTLSSCLSYVPATIPVHPHSQSLLLFGPDAFIHGSWTMVVFLATAIHDFLPQAGMRLLMLWTCCFWTCRRMFLLHVDWWPRPVSAHSHGTLHSQVPTLHRLFSPKAGRRPAIDHAFDLHRRLEIVPFSSL